MEEKEEIKRERGEAGAEGDDGNATGGGEGE